MRTADSSRGVGRVVTKLAHGQTVWAHTESQLTPKWVDALSEDRVVGVALGDGFTLAVTDAGAVFSFGDGGDGMLLGHGSLEAEVLPRQVEALTQSGHRFVAVAAGSFHALALTEEGELYGWGRRFVSGHGRDEPIPHQVMRSSANASRTWTQATTLRAPSRRRASFLHGVTAFVASSAMGTRSTS